MASNFVHSSSEHDDAHDDGDDDVNVRDYSESTRMSPIASHTMRCWSLGLLSVT